LKGFIAGSIIGDELRGSGTAENRICRRTSRGVCCSVRQGRVFVVMIAFAIFLGIILTGIAAGVVYAIATAR
jgi:hypothetical protein